LRDYREQNEHTITSKFPILIIEELIDELVVSHTCTRLELRLCQQVKMHDDDVIKNAFKTHSSYYKLLVMPFGLTNAPTIFQSLMNFVFKEYLRKFILAFFDDILVYNPC